MGRKPCTRISIHVPRVGDDQTLLLQVMLIIYFYPRPPRGGRPRPDGPAVDALHISIHVPRVGDDGLTSGSQWERFIISIHVPRVGDDPFLPFFASIVPNFYPRPPRGGRPDDV